MHLETKARMLTRAARKGYMRRVKIKNLLLDNHDDFDGHAKRNEFTTPEGLILG